MYCQRVRISYPQTLGNDVATADVLAGQLGSSLRQRQPFFVVDHRADMHSNIDSNLKRTIARPLLTGNDPSGSWSHMDMMDLYRYL